MAEPDLCVIGGGPAGRAVAMAGAALGLSVVLVHESENSTGVADLLLPFLALQARRVQGGTEPADLPCLQDRLHDLCTAALPDRRLARLAAMNVRVERGRGRFVDPDTVRVGTREIRARRTVIATGALPLSLPAGLPPSRLITIGGLRTMTAFPEHLLVIGADCQAVAVAQAFRRFGTVVTLASASEELMPELDPELTGPIRQSMHREGVMVRVGEPSLTVALSGEIAAAIGSETIRATHVLQARFAAAVADLGLEAAGIASRGDVLALTPSLRTSNPRVYAVGSAAGAISSQAIGSHVRCVLKAAFVRLRARSDPSQIPIVAFTDPEVATIGLSEADARRRGRVSVWRWPFAETDVARLRGEQAGHVKVVTDRNGCVLGAGLVGPGSHSQIALWTLACASGQTLRSLGDVALPNLTPAEASQGVIRAAAAERLRSPWLQRALGLMRRLA